MDRRAFITRTGALLLSQGLVACQGGSQTTLSVRLLKSSIPQQLVSKFRQQLQQANQSGELDFAPETQLQTLFTYLQTWKFQTGVESKRQPWMRLPFVKSEPRQADLITLGDYWLPQAIQQQLIQPLELSQLEGWQALPQRWQALVRRNDRGLPDSQGKLWGAPYRWGSTVIVYRKEKFEEKGWKLPTDWSDLWRSELKGRISLLNSPREVIGLTLKKLGYGYNTSDLQPIAALPTELRALHQQVKFYSSTAYLQPLLLKDTWVAVGWSTDILPLMQRDRQLAAVIPQSGTALWSDLWVRPIKAAPAPVQDLAMQWIDFCWQAQTARELSLLSGGISPAIGVTATSNLSPALREHPVLLPDLQVIDRSEFLSPLPDSTLNQYRSFWQEMRS